MQFTLFQNQNGASSTPTPTPLKKSPDRTVPGSDVTSTLINLCGRQRMLSQRLTLHLVLAAQGHIGSLAIARDALTLFSDCHGVLSGGKGILPAPWTPALQDAFFGMQGADAPIRAFISMARAALLLVEQGNGCSATGQLAAPLETLVEASSTVLAHLNMLTQCYEVAANENVQHQRQQLLDLICRIQNIAHEARVLCADALAVSTLAGQEAEQEVSQMASTLSGISEQIADLAETARRVH